MNREEQIENFANSQVDCEFFNENLYNGILIGARWADENPKEGLVSIDKACEWLRNELFEDPAEPNPYYLYDVKSKTHNYLDDFIQNFRKAMEE